MTTTHLAEDIKKDEGLRLKAYPDPISGREPWTIGYGYAGAGVTPDTVWTQEQADDALTNMIAQVEGSLDKAFPWWRDMEDLRQDVLANMTYNMGIGGVSNFKHALSAMQAADYPTAADQMLDSQWAKQVPNRANRLATQMRTGVHA
jgi:lysozyme